MTKVFLVLIVLKIIINEGICGVDTNTVNEINNNVNINVNDVNNNNYKCDIKCPPGDDKMACGFDPETKSYKLFTNACNMVEYGKCHNIGFFETKLHFCIQNQIVETRKMYGESCPVFCPSHYRPVCGASKLRAYIYKAFTNGCQLDMLNCRGDEDNGFVEVPLDFCQRHLMKNIFRQQMILSNFDDYRDYHDY